MNSVEGYPFASETFAAIFHELDAPSILTCRMVCRLFNMIYTSDSFLQYKVELFSAGMVDEPLFPLPFTKKLSLLKSIEEAWRTMSFMNCDGYTLRMLDSEGERWRIQGGMLIQDLNPDHSDDSEDNLDFVVRQLPAPGRCIEDTQWTYEAGPNKGNITFLMMDPSEDLLALMEAVHNGDDADGEPKFDINIKFLSASTREPHPSIAGSHILSVTPNKYIAHDYTDNDMMLWGEYVALIWGGYSGSVLIIRSWKAGPSQDPKLVITGTKDVQITAIDQLTETLLVIGVMYELGPCIYIVDLNSLLEADSASTKFMSISDMPYVLSLYYPPLHDDVISREFSITSEGDELDHRSPHVPFSLRPTHRVLSITFKVSEPGEPEPKAGCLLLLPVSNVLARLDGTKTKCDFAWQEWGPHDSLMLEWPELLWDERLLSVTGMRSAIGMYNEDRECTEVEIMDFNPRSWKRHGCPRADPRVVDTSTAIFKEEIKTWLPHTINYCLSESSGDRSWDSLRLTPDHLVVAVVPSEEDEENPYLTDNDEEGNLKVDNEQGRETVEKANMFRVFAIPKSPRAVDRVTKGTKLGQISVPRHPSVPS